MVWACFEVRLTIHAPKPFGSISFVASFVFSSISPLDKKILWEYGCGMKMKTSITLEKEVVAALEEAAREGENRSQVIERLLRQSFAVRERAAIDKRDRNIINAHADELNEEAVDVLGYQVET